MATIYNPWQHSGQDSELEDGLATPVYLEQADEVEDLMEPPETSTGGEMSDEMNGEMEDTGGHGQSPMHAAMSQALTVISSQSATISQLLETLKGTK